LLPLFNVRLDLYLSLIWACPYAFLSQLLRTAGH
jgi:hypothetical protein